MPPCHCKNRLSAKSEADIYSQDIGFTFCRLLLVHILVHMKNNLLPKSQNFCYNVVKDPPFEMAQRVCRERRDMKVHPPTNPGEIISNFGRLAQQL